MLSVCFFSGPAYHRYLHSFPTRRSSDLRTGSMSPEYPHVLTRTLLRTSVIAAHPASVEGLPNGTPVDRKSTRLNSSHTVISYAVFCLKKKNKTTSPTSIPKYTR